MSITRGGPGGAGGANMMCPKCGHFQPRAEICVSCGVIVAKARAAGRDGSERESTEAHARRHSSVAGDVEQRLRGRTPFIFLFVDAWRHINEFVDALPLVGGWRKTLGVLGLVGAGALLFSGGSLTQADFDLAFEAAPPEVQCGGAAPGCVADYRLTLGNMGKNTLTDVVVTLAYGQVAHRQPADYDQSSEFNQHVRRAWENDLQRARSARLEELVADSELRPGGTARRTMSLAQYSARLQSLERKAAAYVATNPPVPDPDGTIDYLVGRILKARTQSFRLQVRFPSEDLVLEPRRVFMAIRSKEAPAREGKPTLGLAAQFLHSIGG